MKPKLSLTCIAGNCEQDVERFLDAFQPHVDEVVMVRAIGSQDPDDTLRIAALRGCVTGEYKNQKEAGWPHVDDFSAARNAALDLATGDWCMWADLDDTAAGMEHAREILSKLPGDVCMVTCPYVVSEQGVIANFRERFWRNDGKSKWHNALHENLVVPSTCKAVRTSNISIIHIPRGDRHCTKERNMRILESIPEEKRTRAHAFYLVMEYARRNDARVIEAARKFLADPESATPERFELFMTLAASAEDFATKASYYTQAVSEDPGRAEAFYELTAVSMACDEPERAMNYARLMMACPWPENPCWNHRRMFYGFFREDLYLQCLRSIGHTEESDVRRTNMALTSGRPIISLLHATRGRPTMATKCRMEWLRMANHPERVEHLFIIDRDDEESLILTRFQTYLNPGIGPVAAWNAAAVQSRGDVLVQLSDDWKPFKGWDTAIIDAIGDTSKPAVLAVNDGHRKDDLLCMAICTRKRWDDQKYLFHPDFFSVYSDDWFSECAFRDGVVIDARDRITFEHIHPAFGKAEMDETYNRSNSQQHYVAGNRHLKRLRDGVLTSWDIEGWCDYRTFYTRVAESIPTDSTFVEVGSWMGQSIIHLCQRLQDLGKSVRVFAVDTFKGEENQAEHVEAVADAGGNIRHIFEENIRKAGVSDMVTIIEGDSAESADKFDDKSCRAIYIDAAHDYESVRKDLAAWWPKLAAGGIWSGHDYPWHEVKKAVDEHAEANGYKVAPVVRVWLKTNTN